ncbi:MAG: hypothetical protein HWQ38_24185 [Nostoc sp. NMS7]|uniref:hypothetical protein n=1 Tax=Nostoc sp. NMS7 TaxID=2815391 RepID=UPI0025F4184F|nr:hypothetical protein [Nostoc sp. NMS7]MBN3949393.1 hypothetical protein [Nostoc sp. NMS7]
MDAELSRTLALAKMSPYYRYTISGLIVDSKEDAGAGEKYSNQLSEDCLKAGTIKKLSSDRQKFLGICLLSLKTAKKLFPEVNSTDFLSDKQVESAVIEAQKNHAKS